MRISGEDLVIRRSSRSEVEFRGLISVLRSCICIFPPALCQAKTIKLLSLIQVTMTIDEYQQKFFELLSFAPHINGSSDAKSQFPSGP